MINFNQLKVFFYAAKYQSFTLASTKLHITQPAVTAQVKLLEEYCGFKLFKKRGRRVHLTDEGKTLLDYAAKAFQYEKEIESVIEDMRELKRGMLRLGTTKTYARYFMPFMMARFHESFPQIRICLDEGSSLEMALSLLDLRNEVAIIAKVEDHPEVCFVPFSQEELVLILSPSHPLTQEKAISMNDLRSEPVIMKETGSGTRKMVNELFHRHGVTPNILMETSNTEFIKQLVQRGDGVSFVVREAVVSEIEEGKIVTLPVSGEKLFLDVSIAYLKNQPLSPPAQALLNLLSKIAPKEKLDQGIRAIMSDVLTRWK
ncbi:MAG: LysR family transcriptional regulator [Deltaproteobacteria bacterium]|nr:LysR family transcriptional regulator [Deltaproteobacteria bacterium]